MNNPVDSLNLIHPCKFNIVHTMKRIIVVREKSKSFSELTPKTDRNVSECLLLNDNAHASIHLFSYLCLFFICKRF